MTFKVALIRIIEIYSFKCVKMQPNKVSVNNMAESASLTIQQIFEARAKWRASNTVTLPADIINKINDIRMEVKSGATADGWHMAGAGKSGHGRHGGGSHHYGPGSGSGSGSGRNNYDRKYNGGGGGAGGGGWNQRNQFRDRDRDRGRYHQPQHTTPDVPINVIKPSTGTRFYNSATQGQSTGESFAKVLATTVPSSPKKESLTALEQLSQTLTAGSSASSDHTKGPTRFKQYKPKFTNSDYAEDDSPESKMLLNIQQAINKLVDENYQSLKRLLLNFLNLGHGNSYLPKFMKMIFNSAIRDKVHCHLFAKILYEMSQEYSFLQTEMNTKYDEFVSTIFNNIEPVYSTDSIDVSNEKIANSEMRKGYSQFITELLKFNVIEDTYFLNIVQLIINTIKTQAVDKKYATSIVECAECLKTIVEVIITPDVDSYKRIKKIIIDTHMDTFKELSNSSPGRPGIIPKAEFAIMDICDMLA